MILGIGHESMVGKDTVGMFIIDYLRSNYRQLKIKREGFADNLYDVCYTMYKWAGFQPRQYYVNHPKDKETILPLIGKTPRDLLIGHGNACREFDPDCWRMPVIREDTRGWLKIITDLRKINEFEGLEKEGHFLLRVMRPGYESDRDSDVDLRPYANRWHATIQNNGDLAGLNRMAITFADTFIIPRITAGH